MIADRPDTSREPVTDRSPGDAMSDAARQAAERERDGRLNPEPSLGARLGQIGVLGWMVVLPMLAALVIGRWMDHRFETGIFFSAPALMIGAVVGFMLAWRWMHRGL